MKLKTIVIATLLATNCLQVAAESSLSGNPYSKSTNFDTSLPDLGDVSQTVFTPLDEQRIGEQIMREVSAVSYTHLDVYKRQGAGIVFPLLPWMYRDEVNQLALAGANLYPQVTQQLLRETGIDPELTKCGMRILPPYDLALAQQWCEKNKIEFTHVGDDLLLPNVAQVRNPRLLQALKQWLILHEVTLIEHTQLAPIQETASLNGWQTTKGETLQADLYIVTSGAWSFELLKETAANIDIKPMRGQILLYQMPVNTLQHILYQDGFYMLQRRDGFLLAGSTLEDVGFDANVTETARREMQDVYKRQGVSCVFGASLGCSVLAPAAFLFLG